MSDGTKIEWTDATWNPVTGCTLVSEGCRHCYAATLAATRLKNHSSREGLARINAAGEAKFTGEVRFNHDVLDQPLRWSRPRMIFVCAHGDLFHEDVPDEWIDQVFAVMALSPQHLGSGRAHPVGLEALGLTLAAHAGGRPEVGKGVVLGGDIAHLKVWPLPNVWLGTSIEDQTSADARIPALLDARAAVRFISAEPLLGPIDVLPYLLIYTHADDAVLLDHSDKVGPEEPLPFHDPATTDAADIATPRLDWVIAGGESGKHARPMHPDWARSLRDQCDDADVAFFFKQWGEWAPFFNQAEHPRCPLAFLDSDGNIKHDPTKADLQRAIDQASSLDAEPWELMARQGKKAAGRLLDGVLHSAFPARAG